MYAPRHITNTPRMRAKTRKLSSVMPNPIEGRHRSGNPVSRRMHGHSPSEQRWNPARGNLGGLLRVSEDELSLQFFDERVQSKQVHAQAALQHLPSPDTPVR